MRYLTIYDNRTDDILAFGTAEECAAMLQTTRNRIDKIVSKCRRGPTKHYAVVIERVPGATERIHALER